MNKLRKILYPFSLLYGELIKYRNIAYEKGIFTSVAFDIPIIVVGNLNVGGTGKSPQIEYLIRLLQNDYKIAVLSRGYKRKSEGFQLADRNSTSEQIGDEPLQFYRKFKDLIVAVDTKRVNGIKQLKNLKLPPNVILLDDAFQHRKVQAGLTILLTAYGNLYVDDTMLPTGYLREKREGAKRAQIIVVTKCPDKLSESEQYKISKKLKPELNQTVFFSTIAYNETIIGKNDEISISELNEYKVLLITGIANSKPLEEFLKSKNIEFKHLKFADHHNFTSSDKERIIQNFKNIQANKKIILTTEKDYVRTFSNDKNQLYYLPIKTKFIDNENDFNKLILNYVQQDSRNS
ncbi:MAG: tetraacyldisaccharide 4'-kinase [Flavobacteriaceae bacterium]|nr:tetraacyldisaccharide 4'-kinase [Flavobacteriaceae bacterium]